MTNEEKTRFRSAMEERTLKFAADVAMLLKRFGGADETLFWLGFVLSLDPEIEDGQRLYDESLELVKIFQSIKTKTRAYLREKGELRC